MSVDVEAHRRAAKFSRFQLASAMQAAFLAHREQQRDRRVRQLMFQQRFGERHQHGAAGTVVAAEGRRPIGDDAVALAPRLGAGTERHRIEMGCEEQSRPRARARQLDNEVARLGRHRNALVSVVEANCGCRAHRP